MKHGREEKGGIRTVTGDGLSGQGAKGAREWLTRQLTGGEAAGSRSGEGRGAAGWVLGGNSPKNGLISN